MVNAALDLCYQLTPSRVNGVHVNIQRLGHPLVGPSGPMLSLIHLQTESGSHSLLRRPLVFTRPHAGANREAAAGARRRGRRSAPGRETPERLESPSIRSAA